MTLTNPESLITVGNITTETLLKTQDNINSSIKELYTIEQSYNPHGIFYSPYDKCIYTIEHGSSLTQVFIIKYNINTKTTSKIELKNGNNKYITVYSMNGYYDITNNTPSYLYITGLGRDQNSASKYYCCYYNIETNTISSFIELSYSMKNKISYIVSGTQDMTNMIMVITIYVL